MLVAFGVRKNGSILTKLQRASGWMLDSAVAKAVNNAAVATIDGPRTLYRIYRNITALLFVTTTMSLTSIWLLLWNMDDVSAHSPAIMIVGFGSVTVAGFSLMAVLSIGFEFGTALCYPSDEAAVGGVLMCGGQLVGWIINILGGMFFDVSNVNQDRTATIQLMAIMTVGMGLSTLLLWTAVTDLPTRPLN